MENSEVRITVVVFYAFNMKSEKTYINRNEEYILADLQDICNTNRLISITDYIGRKTNEVRYANENETGIEIEGGVEYKPKNT